MVLHAEKLFQPLPLFYIETQTELAASPQNIIAVARPLLTHEIVDFGLMEIGAETGTEVRELARRADDAFDARAVGACIAQREIVGQFLKK